MIVTRTCSGCGKQNRFDDEQISKNRKPFCSNCSASLVTLDELNSNYESLVQETRERSIKRNEYSMRVHIGMKRLWVLLFLVWILFAFLKNPAGFDVFYVSWECPKGENCKQQIYGTNDPRTKDPRYIGPNATMDVYGNVKTTKLDEAKFFVLLGVLLIPPSFIILLGYAVIWTIRGFKGG